MTTTAQKPIRDFAWPLSSVEIENTLRAESRRSELTKCVLERFGLTAPVR